MSGPPGVRELVYAVRAATDARTVRWRELNPTSYEAPIPGQGSVVVSRDDANNFYFDVVTPEGKVIESIRDEDAPFADGYTVLSQLYEDARNDARGIANTISGMLSALNPRK